MVALSTSLLSAGAACRTRGPRSASRSGGRTARAAARCVSMSMPRLARSRSFNSDRSIGRTQASKSLAEWEGHPRTRSNRCSPFGRSGCSHPLARARSNGDSLAWRDDAAAISIPPRRKATSAATATTVVRQGGRAMAPTSPAAASREARRTMRDVRVTRPPAQARGPAPRSSAASVAALREREVARRPLPASSPRRSRAG